MSETQREQSLSSSPASPPGPSVARGLPEGEISARVDPAHESTLQPNSALRETVTEKAGDLPPVEDNAVAAEFPASQVPDPTLTRERLRRHARQLAEYLRKRQANLDRREARLNAQLAQYENDLRASRLIFAERLAEWEEKRRILADQEAALARRRAELGEREEAIQQREHVLSRWEETLRQKEVELRHREEELERRRSELLRREAELQFREQDLTSLAVMVEPAGAVSPATAQKADTPAEAEAELARLREEATALLRDLREARHNLRLEERRWRQQAMVEQRQALAELAAEREAVSRRSRALDQFYQELLQLKNQIQAEHLAALEEHLAAQELLAALDAKRAAWATEKILALRQEREALLGAQREEQERRRKELVQLYRRLEELREWVQGERARWEQELHMRRQELQELAQRVQEQQRNLAEREARLLEQQHAWQLHKLGYRMEIQRLRQRLRDLTRADGPSPEGEQADTLNSPAGRSPSA